ncbi:MAG TPA: hypothetical protein VIL65_09155 [Beijerinckiaceae bacterium]|jgi:hypothetical protein
MRHASSLRGGSRTVQAALAAVLAAVLGLLAPIPASAETLTALVQREEGVDAGPCNLSPRPDLAGARVHAVVPARFDHPGIWSTRILLLVGVDGAGNVEAERALTLAAQVPPREIVSVTCKEGRVTIQQSGWAGGGRDVYAWTGRALKPVRLARRS